MNKSKFHLLWIFRLLLRSSVHRPHMTSFVKVQLEAYRYKFKDCFVSHL